MGVENSKKKSPWCHLVYILVCNFLTTLIYLTGSRIQSQVSSTMDREMTWQKGI